MTAVRGRFDSRRQLVALWDVLDARGAVVHRVDADALPDDVIDALCEHEAARIRAIRERDHPNPGPPPVPKPPRQGHPTLRRLLSLIADVASATPLSADGEIGRDQAASPSTTLGISGESDRRSDARRRHAHGKIPDWLDLDRLERTVPQPGWLRLAACRGLDPNWFHPARGQSTAPQKALCATCPVRYACLADDLAAVGPNHDVGIWGGTSQRERRAIRHVLAARQRRRTRGQAA
jgi:WhiB family redox-sensing transcriptional regulator